MRNVSLLAGALALLAACASRDELAAAQQQTAQAQLLQIRSALDVYYVTHAAYPTEAQGLAVLVAERQLESLPTDPWGRVYVYRLAAGAPEVWSFGRDGTPGGTGADADVTSPAASPTATPTPTPLVPTVQPLPQVPVAPPPPPTLPGVPAPGP